MDAGNASRPPAGAGQQGGFDANAARGLAPGNGRGGNRRLTNMEQQLLAEDNTAVGSAGYYGARGPGAGFSGVPGGLGMYGANDPTGAAQGTKAQRLNSIYGAAGLGGAGLRGVPGLMQGQFEDPSGGLAGLQAAQGGLGGAAGLGGLNAMNGLGAQGLQQQQAQQRAMLAQQQAAGGGVDFQGLMPTGFDGTDASAALLGNPAAMAGYPFQAAFNPSVGLGVGADGTPGQAGANLLNVNAAAMGGAPGAMAVARNAQFGNAGAAGPVASLFDQGYNFARSEMALARHQAALGNNAALMGGGGQGGFNLAGLDRQGAAGLRGLGPGGVNPYSNYGADPLMGAAGPVGADPYMTQGRVGVDGGPAGGAHLATIPAIRLAQHRNTLQRRMMVNNLPERKDGSFPVVLYQESDEHKLTAYQCLLRKQLELFEADEDDVRCSTRQGRTAPIKLGQVGLRCRHCAGVQLAARTKGAAYYSQTVEGIYQIAQNMSKVHLCERCYRIPRDVRRQLIVLRSDCRRAIGGKEYWSENIRSLGVYVDDGILRVKKAPKEDDKKEGETKDEVMKEEDEGVTKEVNVEAPKSSGGVVKKEEEKKSESSEKKTDEKDEKTTPMDEVKSEEMETPAEKETPKEDVDSKLTTGEDGDKKKDEGVAEEEPIENGDSGTDAKVENGEDDKMEEDKEDNDDKNDTMEEDKKDNDDKNDTMEEDKKDNDDKNDTMEEDKKDDDETGEDKKEDDKMEVVKTDDNEMEDDKKDDEKMEEGKKEDDVTEDDKKEDDETEDDKIEEDKTEDQTEPDVETKEKDASVTKEDTSDDDKAMEKDTEPDVEKKEKDASVTKEDSSDDDNVMEKDTDSVPAAAEEDAKKPDDKSKDEKADAKNDEETEDEVEEDSSGEDQKKGEEKKTETNTGDEEKRDETTKEEGEKEV